MQGLQGDHAWIVRLFKALIVYPDCFAQFLLAQRAFLAQAGSLQNLHKCIVLCASTASVLSAGEQPEVMTCGHDQLELTSYVLELLAWTPNFDP